MIGKIGAWTIGFVEESGRMSVHLGAVLKRCFTPPVRARAVIEQIHQLGVLSMLVVCVSGFTVGLVLAMQGHNTLKRFGATSALGSLVALSLIRELGPVLAALLVAGRAGSATAARIAAMVTTEQMSALRMMSIDPVHYVLMPRVVGMVIVMPLLAALFIVSGLAGGFTLSVAVLGVDPGSYQNGILNAVELGEDVLGGLFKALVFGGIVGLVATHRGYTCQPTSAGVGAATTSTVVISSMAVLLSDYVLTAFWQAGFQ